MRNDDTDCPKPADRAVFAPPWQRLIESLLREHTEATRLIVHLSDGRELQVEGLANESFGEAIGVLAVRSQDDQRNVVAIRWSEVSECKLEGIQEYPEWLSCEA